MNKIYIIEDNEKVKSELIILLKKYGYECETSDNYQNIVEKCLEYMP